MRKGERRGRARKGRVRNERRGDGEERGRVRKEEEKGGG